MSAGTLLLVGLPIGHPADLAPRAVEALRSAAVIAAEDTRTAARLLRELGLPERPLWSCHDHNEGERAPQVVEALAAGQTVALISEAGLPGISDPGFRVVRAVLEAGLKVAAVPGPSAPLLALITSGLPTDRFTYAGFPPRQGGPRRAFLADLARDPGTLILLEAPHRIVDTLADAQQVLGDRPCSLAISLTKVWERYLRGSLREVHQALLDQPSEVIGEMTLVIGGAPPAGPDDRSLQLIDALAAAGVSPSLLRDTLSPLLDLPRRAIYQRALEARRRGTSPVAEEPDDSPAPG